MASSATWRETKAETRNPLANVSAMFEPRNATAKCMSLATIIPSTTRIITRYICIYPYISYLHMYIVNYICLTGYIHIVTYA